MPVMGLTETIEFCKVCNGKDKECVVCKGKGYIIVWRNNEGKICFKT